MASSMIGVLVHGCALGQGPASDETASGPVGTESEKLAACAQAVNSVKYSYPLHHSWETFDIQNYQDSPIGLAEYPGGGVMYDYHRDTMGNEAPPDGIHPTYGHRDYMGGDIAYPVHNGYDNVIAPARLHIEGTGEIHPVAAGEVTEVIVNPADAGDDIIVVEHPSGYRSRYVHLMYGSARVRVGEQVTPNTVLATLGVAAEHLHFDFHDCDWITGAGPGEPSYYELFRADKRLFGRAPFYQSGPADVSEIRISRGEAQPSPNQSDDLRYGMGDFIQIAVHGQWRFSDRVEIDLVGPFGLPVPLEEKSSDEDRYKRFEVHAGWLFLSPITAPGDWYVRVKVNDVERARKNFLVADTAPNTNGPAQSTPSVVNPDAGTQVAFYRGPGGNLRSRRWTLTGGWGSDSDHGGSFQGRPSCIARSSTQVDCFMVRSDNHLWRWASTNGGVSGSFSDISAGLNVLADPAAITYSSNSMEVIVRRTNNTLQRMSWNGSVFVSLPAGAYVESSPLSCVAPSATEWRCYSRASAGNLHEIAFTNGVQTFQGGVSGGQNLVTVAMNSDVTALLLPGEGEVAHRIDITGRDNANQMVRQTRLRYTDASARWLPLYTIGASELTQVPSCSARLGSQAHECFSADQDRRLVTNTWTGTRWTGWNPVALAPGDRNLAPSVFASSATRLEVAHVSPDDSDVEVTRSESGVYISDQHFGVLGSHGPGCAVRDASTVDCFGVESGQLKRRTRTSINGAFGGPSTVPLALPDSQPSAVSRNASNLSVFYRTPGGSIRFQTLNGSSWLSAEGDLGVPPGGLVAGAPGCVLVPGNNTIACFVRDASNNLWTKTAIAGGSTPWAQVPNVKAFSSPSAVSTGGVNLAVFYRGANHSLRSVALTSGTWGAEENLAGSLSSAPACISRTSPTRIDCFAQGFAALPEDLLHYQYQASIGWMPPRALGQGLVNLALNKTATQSSTYVPSPAPASRAVDGNLDGRFSQGSVTHTAKDPLTNGMYAWWQVDLGQQEQIDHIQVFNRTDTCCTSRINGFLVDAKASAADPWVPVSTTFDQYIEELDETHTFNRTDPAYPGVAIPIKGNYRYIRIRLNHSDYLSLAEVMVMGTERP